MSHKMESLKAGAKRWYCIRCQQRQEKPMTNKFCLDCRRERRQLYIENMQGKYDKRLIKRTK